MGEWNNIEFQRLAKVQGGFAFKSDDYKVDGSLLVRIGNLQKGNISFQNSVYIDTSINSYSDFNLNNGDILIGLTGDLGKLAKVKKNDLPALLNQRVGRFIVSENTDAEYVYQLVSSEYFQEKLKVYFEGGAQANISPKQIESVCLYTTTSKPEQTRIAQILSKADSAIKQTEALIAKYQRIKTGLMQDLLTKGIDEKGNIRNEKTHRFKTEKGLRVPEEWNVDYLGILCNEGGGSIQTGPFGSQLHAEDYKTEGIPIITVEHLINNRISHVNLPLVGNSDYIRLRKYTLKTGDLVFSRVGSIDRCSITTEAENGWMFSGRCLRVSPGKYFEPYFLMYQLNFDIAKNFILANAVGSTMKCLNTTIISNTPIFQPSLNEQKQISVRIFYIEDFIQKLIFNKEKLQYLKTGLMQDLLSGKIRFKNIN